MSWKTSITLAGTLVLCATTVHAQAPEDNTNIWTLQDENSSYSHARRRDHLYTNGLRLGWVSNTAQVPEAVGALSRAIGLDGSLRIAFDLTQQIYTPLETHTPTPDPRDRPYAGLLLGNLSLIADTATTRSILALSAGVLGPYAGGEAVQNGFHDLFHITAVRGWNAQIQNTPAFELLGERTWRLPVLASGIEVDALPALTGGIGNLRDYAQVGATLRVGQGLVSDFGTPRPRPGLSSGDVFTPPVPSPGMSMPAPMGRPSLMTCYCNRPRSAAARMSCLIGWWAKRRLGSLRWPSACASRSPMSSRRRNFSTSMAGCTSSDRRRSR